jgi:HlyD family secretion protein
MPEQIESNAFHGSPGESLGSSNSQKLQSRNRQRRVLARWLRRVLLIASSAAISAALVYAWLPKPIPVDIAQVSSAPLRVTVDEDGQARVKDRYVVSAPLTGSLARIELDPGDKLSQSQVLASIVPVLPPLLDERTRTSAEAQVAAANAAKSQAQAQIQRATAALEYAKAEAVR